MSHNLMMQESLHVANARIYENSPFLRDVVLHQSQAALDMTSGEESPAESQMLIKYVKTWYELGLAYLVTGAHLQEAEECLQTAIAIFTKAGMHHYL